MRETSEAMQPNAGMPDIGAVLKYLPVIMGLVSALPGVLFGALVTYITVFGFIGLRRFTDVVSPIAGFHVVLFFVCREIHPFIVQGIARLRHVRAARAAREVNVKSLERDIVMQFRVTVD